MDEPRTGSEREAPDLPIDVPIEARSDAPGETESVPLLARRARPRQADIEVTLGRFLIFLAFPLVALAGALRLFDVDLGVFPPRLVTSNPPEASAEPAPEPAPEKTEQTPEDAGNGPDRPDRR